MEEVLVEGGHISDVGAEITAKLQGVLVEELTPIHSTLTVRYSFQICTLKICL